MTLFAQSCTLSEGFCVGTDEGSGVSPGNVGNDVVGIFEGAEVGKEVGALLDGLVVGWPVGSTDG